MPRPGSGSGRVRTPTPARAPGLIYFGAAASERNSGGVPTSLVLVCRRAARFVTNRGIDLDHRPDFAPVYGSGQDAGLEQLVVAGEQLRHGPVREDRADRAREDV